MPESRALAAAFAFGAAPHECAAVRPVRVAVLLLAEDRRFESTPYLLTRLVRVWRDDGIEVEVVRGVDGITAADVVIPHFDVTETPAAYHAALTRQPLALNARLVTIAKSSYSAILVGEDDPYAGPVIVKTDRNYGGLPELRLRLASAPLPAWIVARIASGLRRLRATPVVWREVETLSPDEYPVYASRCEIPPGVFDNPHLVVERFLPEIEGEDYCVRYLYCLGDREIGIRLRSKAKVVKAAGAHHCEVLPTIPEELRAIRRRLGFDYGKLDYVIVDDAVILLDVNRTPVVSALERFGLTGRVVRYLAGGRPQATPS